MNNTGSWFAGGLTHWMSPNSWRTNEKKIGREIREQINKLSRSCVLDDAGVDDAQVLTLTREDLNELYPGVKNFQLRRKIMEIITNTAKESLQPGPETFADALKTLMQHNNSRDAAVHNVLRECFRSFREVEEQLKAAQASLEPYIEVLNRLIEESVNKTHQGIETPSLSGQYQHYDQTNSIYQSSFEPSIKVNSIVCGQTFGAHQQILAQLERVTLTNITDCQMIMVFCPVASRVGTDIEEALKKIPAKKEALLVVMHHTYNPNFVGPSPNRSTLPNIVDQVQVLFHDTFHGLLTCPTNKNAVSKIQSILNLRM